MQDLAEKIRQLEHLLTIDPDDATGFFMLGKLQLDAGDLEKAAASLEKCINLKPDYSAAYRFCGDAYRRMDNVARAREVYERGIAVAEERGDLQTVKEMKAFLGKLPT